MSDEKRKGLVFELDKSDMFDIFCPINYHCELCIYAEWKMLDKKLICRIGCKKR